MSERTPMLWTLVMVSALLLGGGQAVEKPHLCDEARVWVQMRGGLMVHPQEAAMQRTVDRLAEAAGLSPVALWVVDNPEPTAAAAPPNDVFVHTGLIGFVDHAELAAVLAHELGHLAERHEARVFRTLDGRQSALEEEARADALGMMILREAGDDPAAMVRAMTRVRDRVGVKDPAWFGINERLKIMRRTLAIMNESPSVHR